jgi:carbamoyltransferase
MDTVIGISAGAHDAACSVVHKGEILFAAHSERYSGVKSDKTLSDDMLLDAYRSLPPRTHFQTMAYYERPWARYMRQLYSGEKFIPSKQDYSVEGLLPIKMGSMPIAYFNHHQCHAAAAFQTSPFNQATCVVIDAIGEMDCITIWDAKYNNKGEAIYNQVYSKSYPNSIGLMYSAVTARLGLRPMDEEYIVMGMAAYGEDKYAENFRMLIDKEFNFSYNFHAGLPDDFLPDADPYDLAASVQTVTEELVMDVITRALFNYNRNMNICYGGGVALNCVANTRIRKHAMDDLWIMPNPGDAGASLGAAALAYKKKLNWTGPYLGYNINPDTFYPVDAALNELLSKQIVGVAHGKAEFGPRALGNRSLFADPRGADIKDRVNEIKQRQKFRPFAPVIMEEHAHRYFNISKGYESPYMQFVSKCFQPNDFPAICHEDLTSRVQTVNMNQHPGLYQLLASWKEKTNCPMLLNTSLNIRGKPMVNNRSQADDFQKEYGVKVVS